MKKSFVLLLAVFGLVAVAVTPVDAARHAGGITINGSGSSFDGPLISHWASIYRPARINYQVLGSGTGQQQLNEGLTDFGAFDVPMLTSDNFSNFAKITQLPITLGGEAVTYNLPGYKGPLKLTGYLIGQIYMGRITKWTDKKLTARNPGLKKLTGKSDENITVVHRSDSSGTTYIFTDFLSRTNVSWRKGPGLGPSKLPAWPVGVGGSHSTGVDAAVNGTPGAIGYVENSYAIENKRSPAFVQNRSGRYLQPTLKGVTKDAAQVKKITATHFSIVYQKGDASYPISGFSWAGVYTKGSNWSNGRALCNATVKFLRWSGSTGQNGVGHAPLFYVKLPKNVASYAAAQLKKVNCGK